MDNDGDSEEDQENLHKTESQMEKTKNKKMQELEREAIQNDCAFVEGSFKPNDDGILQADHNDDLEPQV